MTPIGRAAFAAACAHHNVASVDSETAARFMPVVRAAIAAIREPDVAMACCGLGEWQSSTDFGALKTEAADFDLAWKAMIDRLLED